MRHFGFGVVIGASAAGILAFLVNANAQNDQLHKFTLPFEIVGSSGATVMKVEDSGYGPLLTLGSGNRTVRIGGSPAGMAIQVKNGAATVNAVAGQSVAAVNTQGPGGAVNFGYSQQDGFGMTVAISDNPAVELGVKPGRNGVLRIYTPDGKVAAMLGSNPGAGGGGSAYFYNVGGQLFAYATPDGDSGTMGIVKAERVVAELTGSKDGTGGKIGVYDNSGGQVFAAASTGGKGTACAYSPESQPKCLQPK